LLTHHCGQLFTNWFFVLFVQSETRLELAIDVLELRFEKHHHVFRRHRQLVFWEYPNIRTVVGKVVGIADPALVQAPLSRVQVSLVTGQSKPGKVFLGNAL
jgi:hypothetical protein